MALKAKVATALLTDTGRVRGNNEDAVGEDQRHRPAGAGGRHGRLQRRRDRQRHLGQYRAGCERAGSGRACKRGEIDAARAGHSVEALLLKTAGREARTRRSAPWPQSQPQCAGMGTTIVTCMLHDDRDVDRLCWRFPPVPLPGPTSWSRSPATIPWWRS